MKIGILTFHAAQNYGAVLQCRCLYEVLRGLGHEVHVLDYRPAFLTEPYKLWKNAYLKHPLTLLKVAWKLTGALRRRRGFADFEKTFSPVPCRTEGFDAIVFGSDQIWNTLIDKGFDPVFFASDPQFAATRNIAYAASDGSVTLSEKDQKTFADKMQRFQAIGVREETLQRMLADRGIRAEINLDPVLLAGREVVDRIAADVPRRKPFVLTYEAVDHPEVLLKAHAIAREAGLQVISIARTPYRPGRVRYSPAEFAALVRDARHVVTTSFHGVALSLLYHTPFTFVPTGTRLDERINHILALEANGSLETIRIQSLEYLKNNLK